MLFKKKKKEEAQAKKDMSSGELREVEASLAEMKAQQELSMDALHGVAGGKGEVAPTNDKAKPS